MRIVSWNIENVSKRLGELPQIVARLGTPDVLCLQEAHIREQDRALLDVLPGYACHCSLPRDPKNVTFRGGRAYGVVTYVSRALGPARPEVPAWDREGRIVITHLEGLAIGNVYAVNGTDKWYFDHEQGAVSGDRHAFKRRFQALVLQRAAKLRAETGVVMAGDWNVSRTKQDITPRLRTEEPHALARAQLNDLLVASGMHDIWRERNPTTHNYTWFNARSRRLDAARVDYILVSEELLPRVEEAGILAERAGSDHAPLTLRLR